jgi:sugar/nucleoside kinase (ribokinase family)
MPPLTLHAFGEMAAHVFASAPSGQSTSDSLELGPVEITAGGGSTLVCQQVAAFGHRVRLDAMVGRDQLGSWLLGELEPLNIECPTPVRCGVRSTRTLVLQSDSGTHQIMHELSDGDPSQFVPAAHTVKDCRFVYAPGFPGFEPLLAALASTGVETVVDLGYRPWLVDPDIYRARVLDLAQFATVGLLSAEGLTNDQRQALMADLAAAGPRIVMATIGRHGAWVQANGGRARHVGSVACQPVNTLGAGDAFTAGLIVGLTEGLDPFESTALACTTAAAVISMFPAVPSRADVEALRSADQTHCP